ncbi:DUF981 family protein [Streptomyces sp. NBC_01217]|uniref:DUF981 family protein n=1 Tax=Streptomyces sp. NBC_01217 TaxID=2903779 RepID=UPI002E0EE27D|nr:DUF981 domain-containing protein [Streptomyces sp. NBC_01217]
MTLLALTLAAPGLKIDWTGLTLYNTIISLSAGAGLLLVVALGRQLLASGRTVTPDGWALAFGAIGLVLLITGLHMSLAWPLVGGGFPQNNIIFGEPAVIFGVVLLAASLYLWKRGAGINASDRIVHTVRVTAPISVLVFGVGLACLGIAAAGWKYTIFAAPAEEPIAGLFAEWPVVETSFVSGAYLLVGIGAILFPFALRRPSGRTVQVVGVAWGLAGLAYFLFGALAYFTHIGLIMNTK